MVKGNILITDKKPSKELQDLVQAFTSSTIQRAELVEKIIEKAKEEHIEPHIIGDMIRKELRKKKIPERTITRSIPDGFKNKKMQSIRSLRKRSTGLDTKSGKYVTVEKDKDKLKIVDEGSTSGSDHDHMHTELYTETWEAKYYKLKKDYDELKQLKDFKVTDNAPQTETVSSLLMDTWENRFTALNDAYEAQLALNGKLQDEYGKLAKVSREKDETIRQLNLKITNLELSPEKHPELNNPFKEVPVREFINYGQTQRHNGVKIIRCIVDDPLF